MARSLLTLPDREVHLWLAAVPETVDPQAAEAYRALMTPDERERHLRFHFENNRNEFLLTRALVRTTLSRYAEVDPRDWRFQPGSHGRPELSHPALPWLRFNLTNTHGLVACVVARGRDAGVDAEYLDRRGQTVEIADRFFAPQEVAELRSLPADAQRDRFFDYWTLKESYIKARGLGLSIPLDQFAFLLGKEGPVRIACDPRLGDRSEDWQFAQYRPTPQHKVAVGIRRGDGPELDVRVSWTVPLRD